MDEGQGTLAQSALVWTGTNPDGSYAGASCGDWTGTGTGGGIVGTVATTGGEWTNAGLKSCDGNLMNHIYCFQQ
jgi:hypothetical protein